MSARIAEELRTGHQTKAELERIEGLKIPAAGEGELLPPEWLSEEAAQEFLFLVGVYAEYNILSKLDLQIVAIYADLYIKYKEIASLAQAAEDIKDKAALIRTQDTLYKILKSAMVELGMTPAARMKISGLTKTKKDIEDPLEKMLGGI